MLKRAFRRFQRAGLALLGAGEQAGDPFGGITTHLGKIEQDLAMMRQLFARNEMVAALAEPRYADPLRLEHSGFKVHSEYDEDGIIDEIFRRIGTQSRICIEFGAGDGNENCTTFLLMQGWRGLWIEAAQKNLDWIKRRLPKEIESGQLVVKDNFITVDTIDDVIRASGFSGEIDLLVVDIDGNDYHIVEKIRSVSPRVICVEYNSNLPPTVGWVMPRNDAYVWDHFDYRIGASLKAFETMLFGRGYALVGCSFSGVNAFFVRKDLVAGKFAEPFTAENHYNPWRPHFTNYQPYRTTAWRGRQM